MRPHFFICFLLSIIFFLLSFSIAHSDLSSDTTALLALRKAVAGRSLLWNISELTPCNWTGVICQANRVIELRLPAMGLSGRLPLTIGNLSELQTLSLRFNALSGPLPADIGNLASLRNLYLQGNLFTGEIPVFIFNLHNLTSKQGGEDPQHGEVGVSGEKPVADSGRAPALAAQRGGTNKGLVFFGNIPKEFDLEDLLRASAEVLGKGTFGTTYKASLDVGMTMAVKRLKDVNVSEKEFREKIEAVGKINHENLVPLRAYYFNKDEKLLVCDYMPMGSLSALLHGNRGAGRTPINWDTRSSIALGAARAIAHLHSEGPRMSHGNIKSSNILLTRTFEARVSDFGLAHLAGATAAPNRIDGYRAPEVTDSRKISQKADVYSFGVLLLELLTGKAPNHSELNEERVDLPRWVLSVVKDEWTSEVFDLELLRYQNVEEDMVQLLQVAISCTAQYPDNRPSMQQVSTQIEELCSSHDKSSS
ncbi:probable inactive receptor kinase At1g48480 isoform X2 [Euphorbia lathyris]|uniref:probable inactive receptor kinase At1g48480 isoform X2 n=1 Tax=Euphorbia lathyris TaxID=212925 RepID=UPI00331423E8